MDDYKQFYKQNADFKRFVDACIRDYGHDLDYALKSPIIQEYAKSLMKGGCNERDRKENS